MTTIAKDGVVRLMFSLALEAKTPLFNSIFVLWFLTFDLGFCGERAGNITLMYTYVSLSVDHRPLMPEARGGWGQGNAVPKKHAATIRSVQCLIAYQSSPRGSAYPIKHKLRLLVIQVRVVCVRSIYIHNAVIVILQYIYIYVSVCIYILRIECIYW